MLLDILYLGNYGLWAKSSPLLVFIKEVQGEHGPVYPIMYKLKLFFTTRTRWAVETDRICPENQNIYSLSIFKKSSLTLGIDFCPPTHQLPQQTSNHLQKMYMGAPKSSQNLSYLLFPFSLRIFEAPHYSKYTYQSLLSSGQLTVSGKCYIVTAHMHSPILPWLNKTWDSLESQVPSDPSWWSKPKLSHRTYCNEGNVLYVQGSKKGAKTHS